RQQADGRRRVRRPQVAGDDGGGPRRTRPRRAGRVDRCARSDEVDERHCLRRDQPHRRTAQGPARRTSIYRGCEREGARGQFVGLDTQMRIVRLKADATDEANMFQRQLAIAGALIVTAGFTLVAGQAPQGSYTAAQAAQGRAVYQRECAGCHLPDLKGAGDAAPLAGADFIASWGRRSPRELMSFMHLTMPPTRPGALSTEEYQSVAAFILQQNGAAAGNQPFAPSDIAIGTIASGQAPAAAPQQAAGRGAAPAGQAAGGGRGRGAAPPVGITVEGEVKNFVPVTEAMRRNPDPGDWLMIRRDYHATDFSPLN